MSYRRNIYRISTARMISVAGTEAAFVALLALMYEMTDSAIWASFALLASIGTMALVSPISGTLGDRFDRRKVMIASDLAAAVAFLGLVFVDSPEAVVALCAIAAAAQSPFLPAARAAVPNLVPSDMLAWANSTVGTFRTAGFIGGPLLGGALVAVLGPTYAFAGNAATFVISAALILTLREATFSLARKAEEEVRGLTAGFRFLWNDRALLTLTIAWSVFVLGVGVLLVAEYPMAQEFDAGPVGYGMLASGWGLGGLVGAFLGRKIAHGQEANVLIWGTVLMSIALGGAAGAPIFAAVVLAMTLGGVAEGAANVAEELIVQYRTPDAVRSRVFAASEAAILSVLGVSFIVGGPFVEHFGPRPAYVACGIAGLLAAVIIAALKIGHTAAAPGSLAAEEAA